MINLKDYRENPQKYITGATNKGVEIDRDRFAHLDERVRNLKGEIDTLKSERNELSSKISTIEKGSDEFTSLIATVGTIKEKIGPLEEEYATLEGEFVSLLYHIPSPAFDDVLVGASDKENGILATIGEKPSFDFEPKAHRDLLEAKGLLDQERAVKVSGSRFQIMRGQFAQLQFALMTWVSNKLVAKGFTMTLVPQLVKEDALYATGYLPNESSNIYRVNPKLQGQEQDQREEDDLYLIGTSEVPLIAQHSNEVFDEDQLPLRYVGYSSCYRREAGTYGKDTKGLIRVHQFDKVEMVSFVDPADSEKEHEMLREIEEEIFTELGISFQRIDICTGDLGAPAAKKYDLEARFPGIGMYKEVTSTSNTTDFQTRRANIKVKTQEGKVFAHSLNGTAVALGRALAAIVENYQTAEGDIMVPDVLKPFLTFESF